MDQAGDRRRQILAAAEKVFDSSGYAAATMEAVAQEAGIAKGSIYNYFQSKQDLFAQVFNAVLAEEEPKTQALADLPAPAGQRLEAMMDQWLQRLRRYRHVGRLMLEFYAAAARDAGPGPIGQSLRQAHGRWRQRLASVIQQGVASGEFAATLDPHVAANLILAVSNGLTMHVIMGIIDDVDQETLDALKRAMIAGLHIERQDKEARQ